MLSKYEKFHSWCDLIHFSMEMLLGIQHLSKLKACSSDETCLFGAVHTSIMVELNILKQTSTTALRRPVAVSHRLLTLLTTTLNAGL